MGTFIPFKIEIIRKKKKKKMKKTRLHDVKKGKRTKYSRKRIQIFFFTKYVHNNLDIVVIQK